MCSESTSAVWEEVRRGSWCGSSRRKVWMVAGRNSSEVWCSIVVCHRCSDSVTAHLPTFKFGAHTDSNGLICHRPVLQHDALATSNTDAATYQRRAQNQRTFRLR